VAAFRSVALDGRITLHWVAELIAFSKQPGLGAIKPFCTQINTAPATWSELAVKAKRISGPLLRQFADGRVSRLHNHLVRVVGMEKVEGRARVASFVIDA
jgi:hypothetical protein